MSGAANRQRATHCVSAETSFPNLGSFRGAFGGFNSERTTCDRENILVDREKEARDRAEAMFKKSEDRRRKAAVEQEAEAEAVRTKTARLRALRLAAEAAKRNTESINHASNDA
jgi:hypothetical protein